MKKLLIIPYMAVESFVIMNTMWDINGVEHIMNYWSIGVYFLFGIVRLFVSGVIFDKKVEK